MYRPFFVRPCRPISARSAPVGDAWLHEPKLDGYRLQIVKTGRVVRLYSRNGYDWTKRLAGLAGALGGIPWRSATIDAQLVFPDAGSAPDFAGLQEPWPIAGNMSSRSSPSISCIATAGVSDRCH